MSKLSPEQRDRELPGFGYPSVRLQIHHLIGAEEYWIGVLQGKFEVEDNDAAYPTMAALEEYRAQVAQATDAYLSTASESELNTSREMVTWQGKKRLLVPAHVVLRTLTHIYHHQGTSAGDVPPPGQSLLGRARLSDRLKGFRPAGNPAREFRRPWSGRTEP